MQLLADNFSDGGRAGILDFPGAEKPCALCMNPPPIHRRLKEFESDGVHEER